VLLKRSCSLFLIKMNINKPKPRLLIAGGAHSDIPLIKAAQRLGFYVITSGNRANDLGHEYSDEVHLADFSDAEAMLSLARQLKINAICASCNDFSALTASYVAERLGLPGHDSFKVANILHHKDKYREFAHRVGIPSPLAFGCGDITSVRDALQKLRFPIIIKPVDLTGGKGITRVDNHADALLAAENAFLISKAKRIVAEEFIEGSRHGFSAILINGRVRFSFTDDEQYHLSQYLVSAASAPTSSRPESIKKLMEYSEVIARELKLVDGIFHIQYIEPNEGDPVIIEICRRPPGDLYVDLVRHATGAPYAEWIVAACSGLSTDAIRQMPVTQPVTRHCLMASSSGKFFDFDFDAGIEKRIVEKLIWGKKGELVIDPNTHKFGIVFVLHDNIEQMLKVAPSLQKLLAVKVI